MKHPCTVQSFFVLKQGCIGCYDKIPQAMWLQQQNLCSHFSGDWKSKVKVPAELFSFEIFLLVLWIATLLLPLHLVVSLFAYIPGVSLCVLISSYKAD